MEAIQSQRKTDMASGPQGEVVTGAPVSPVLVIVGFRRVVDVNALREKV
jgi:hypothetical protein